MPEAVTEPAPAKINPFLRVLGRRDDGYHEIETLVLPVTLADEVTVRPLDDHLIWVMDVFGEEGGINVPTEDVPRDDTNLASIAATALRSARGVKRGAQISIRKRIPVAAGLGGGSADAAATLRALNRGWGLDLSLEDLSEVAIDIGSDVSALLHPRPVIVRGRGERVESLALPETAWVLLTQPFGVSATDAYRWWDEDGALTGPDPGQILEALKAGDVRGASGLLFNDLEVPVSSRHPEVALARERLLEAGALGAIMSGSGPTVAGLFAGDESAEQAASLLTGLSVRTLVHEPNDSGDEAWVDRAAQDVIAEEPW